MAAHESHAYYDVIKVIQFRRYCPFQLGIRVSPVDSPHEGAVMSTFEAFLLSVWTKFIEAPLRSFGVAVIKASPTPGNSTMGHCLIVRCITQQTV